MKQTTFTSTWVGLLKTRLAAPQARRQTARMPSMNQRRWMRRGLLAGAVLSVAGIPSAFGSKPTAGVAVLLSDLRNPFFATVARSFEQQIRGTGSTIGALTVLSAGFDADRQAAQLDAQISSGIRLVVVTPIDGPALAPHVARAKRAGVKIVAVDSRVEGADLIITTDNVAAGEMSCGYLAEKLEGRGRVVIVDGPANTADADRLEGCSRILRRYPGISIGARTSNAGGSREGGLERMVAVMASIPHIDGVFAINDLTALGVEQAARQAGRKEMIVSSVDGSPAVVERLKDPSSLIEATASQNPAQMGRLAAEGASSLLGMRTVASPLTLLKPTLVTRANVAGYRGW